MGICPNVDIKYMLPPTYKKGPSRPNKLRLIEHDKTWSKIGRSGVDYRCIKCDNFNHNSRKC